MRNRTLEASAQASYVERLRRDPGDVYAAYRIYERGLYGGHDRAMLRQVVSALVAHDPWLLASDVWFPPDVLTRSEAERLERSVGAGLPAGTAAYLRAGFWLRTFRRGSTERFAARRALACLRRVPTKLRAQEWYERVAEAHDRAGDWPSYRRAFPRLFAATAAEWRAHPLCGVLRKAAARRDWRTYDRWRREWDALPERRMVCECSLNHIATCDGLRALAARRLDEVPQHLESAVRVVGCPHLNSGGLRLDLVSALVRRRLHLDACRIYLDRAASFRVTPELTRLQRSLASAGDG